MKTEDDYGKLRMSRDDQGLLRMTGMTRDDLG